jgi:hypothetical protein
MRCPPPPHPRGESVAKGFRSLDPDDTMTSTSKEATKAMAQRQKAWLSRGNFATAPATWRPRKLHRSAAKKWAFALDCQFKLSYGHVGLSLFQKPQPPKLMLGPWSNWRTWPHLNISQDLGSDGNTAFHGLERLFGLDCDQTNDECHACNRDLDLAIKHVDLWGYWLCLMISFNVPHGSPHEDRGRMRQIHTTMQDVYDRVEDHR